MTCDEYQNQILSGVADVDGHHCPECSSFAEALREIDAKLIVEFSGVHAAPEFNETVRARITGDAQLIRPTPLPEVLEAIAWSGTGAAALGGIWLLSPAHIDVEVLGLVATVFVLIAATWSSFRCFAELRH